MKRWLLVLALLLSVGLNLGLVGSLWVQRMRARALPAAEKGLRLPELDRLADRLGLEGEERLRFVEAQRRFIDAVRREGRALARERWELRRQLTARAPDRQRVEALVTATSRRAEALDRAFAENVLLVGEVLDGPREQRYVRMLAQLYSRARAAPETRRR